MVTRVFFHTLASRKGSDWPYLGHTPPPGLITFAREMTPSNWPGLDHTPVGRVGKMESVSETLYHIRELDMFP